MEKRVEAHLTPKEYAAFLWLRASLPYRSSDGFWYMTDVESEHEQEVVKKFQAAIVAMRDEEIATEAAARKQQEEEMEQERQRKIVKKFKDMALAGTEKKQPMQVRVHLNFMDGRYTVEYGSATFNFDNADAALAYAKYLRELD